MTEAQGNNPDAAYNWNPAVHAEHFDETLYYVLLHLKIELALRSQPA